MTINTPETLASTEKNFFFECLVSLKIVLYFCPQLFFIKLGIGI